MSTKTITLVDGSPCIVRRGDILQLRHGDIVTLVGWSECSLRFRREDGSTGHSAEFKTVASNLRRPWPAFAWRAGKRDGYREAIERIETQYRLAAADPKAVLLEHFAAIERDLRLRMTDEFADQ